MRNKLNRTPLGTQLALLLVAFFPFQIAHAGGMAKRKSARRTGGIVLCQACKAVGAMQPHVGKPINWTNILASKKRPNPLRSRIAEGFVAGAGSTKKFVVNRNEAPSTSSPLREGASASVSLLESGTPHFFARNLGAGKFPTFGGTTNRSIFPDGLPARERYQIGFAARFRNGLRGELTRLDGISGEEVPMSAVSFAIYGHGTSASDTEAKRLIAMAAFLTPGDFDDLKRSLSEEPDFVLDGKKVWDRPNMRFAMSRDMMSASSPSFIDEVWRHPDFTLVAPALVSPGMRPWAPGGGSRARDTTPSSN